MCEKCTLQGTQPNNDLWAACTFTWPAVANFFPCLCSPVVAAEVKWSILCSEVAAAGYSVRKLLYYSFNFNSIKWNVLQYKHEINWLNLWLEWHDLVYINCPRQSDTNGDAACARRGEHVNVWPSKETDNEWNRMKEEYLHIDDLPAMFFLNSTVLLVWHSKHSQSSKLWPFPQVWFHPFSARFHLCRISTRLETAPQPKIIIDSHILRTF